MPLELWAQAYRAGLCVVERPVERIYFDGDRSFGQDLDDPDRRFRYYLRVWEEALGRDDG
jgi:dolichol-phosphate mannosyltransferase